MHSLVVLENVTYSLYLFNSPQTIYSRLNTNNLIKWCNDDIMMTSANYFDAYPLVYYHFSFYPSFFLSFFLFLFLSFFALRKWGWEGKWTEFAARVEKRAGSVREAEAQEALL